MRYADADVIHALNHRWRTDWIAACGAVTTHQAVEWAGTEDATAWPVCQACNATASQPNLTTEATYEPAAGESCSQQLDTNNRPPTHRADRFPEKHDHAYMVADDFTHIRLGVAQGIWESLCAGPLDGREVQWAGSYQPSAYDACPVCLETIFRDESSGREFAGDTAIDCAPDTPDGLATVALPQALTRDEALTSSRAYRLWLTSSEISVQHRARPNSRVKTMCGFVLTGTHTESEGPLKDLSQCAKCGDEVGKARKPKPPKRTSLARPAKAKANRKTKAAKPQATARKVRAPSLSRWDGVRATRIRIMSGGAPGLGKRH